MTLWWLTAGTTGWCAARTYVDRTVAALELIAPSLVDGYRRYLADALPVARLVLEAAARPPTRRATIRSAAAAPATASRLLAWSRRSVGDVLRHYFGGHDARGPVGESVARMANGLMGPAMAGGPAVWGLASDTPGSGLGALALAFKHLAPVGRPVGGSGALTDALASSMVEAGGTVLVDTRVTDIFCEGSAVSGVGVVDAAGDAATITAPTVVVASNPAAAVVRYLRSPPPQASAFVQRWRDRPVGRGYEAKIDARLTGLPTRKHDGYRVLAEQLSWTDHLSPSTLVTPSLAEIDDAHRLMGEGRIAEQPILFINMPSILDPTLLNSTSMDAGRPGDTTGASGHVLSIEVLFTPYELAGGWSNSREPQRWLDVASSLFEPGLDSLLADWRVVTPVDYERRFYMPGGYADSFAGGPLAVMTGGDHPELTRYETPVAGLYLTGAATFPGAGVWGAPGRNAASVILESLN